MILPLPCIIVAGGKSSRMGRDKALLPFGGYDTLTQYQLQRVSPWFKSLHVSCKNRDKFEFKASFIEDLEEFREFSPLIALYSILKKLKTDVALLSVDTPFVTKDIYRKLYENFDGHDCVVARSPFGSHQLCAIYSPKILKVLREQILQNNHKIKNLLQKIDTKYINFDKNDPFMNLNKPDDYKKAKEKL